MENFTKSRKRRDASLFEKGGKIHSCQRDLSLADTATWYQINFEHGFESSKRRLYHCLDFKRRYDLDLEEEEENNPYLFDLVRDVSGVSRGRGQRRRPIRRRHNSVLFLVLRQTQQMVQLAFTLC